MSESETNAHSTSLLDETEPPPFYVIHAEATRPVLLVCDHASDRFPLLLGDMGLDPFARRCHLAVDIGAGAVTEYLADSLGATAVLAQYSRLVIDCNRDLMDEGAFLQYGDGIRVPANCNLQDADRTLRAEGIYRPYHAAIEAQVERLSELGAPPVFIAIHSFTPVLNGVSRPWEVGVLWDQDQDLHSHFVAGLQGEGYVTGDNQPYSGKAPADYTIDHHAETRSLPCVGIEIRQDLVSNAAGVARVANSLHRIVETYGTRSGTSIGSTQT
jgi:predicted N-formylglutamate amidohydrolase